VSQLGIAGWGPVSEVKDFAKTNQIDKFDQRQKPAKWAQLLAAGLINRGSVDFSGLRTFFTKPFTAALFPVSLISSFYHLGTSFMILFALINLYHKRRPDGFSIFRSSTVQN